MRRRLIWATAIVVLLALAAGAAAWYLVGTTAGRATLLARAAQEVAGGPVAEFDGLRVFLCGTGSPLASPGRAQACVAVTAGTSLYVVDAGAGSHATMQFSRQPTRHLRAVLVTHLCRRRGTPSWRWSTAASCRTARSSPATAWRSSCRQEVRTSG